MPAFPLPLLACLAPADALPVQDWWDALADADRAALLTLWSRRGNRCRFSLAAAGDDPPAWHRLPLVEARFTDDDQPGDDWRPEWFDHLLSNPDMWVRWEPVRRTFHICTTHAAARAVLRAGFIPADFACPLAAVDCPMRQLLDCDPGRSLRLVWHGAEVAHAGQERLP